MNLDVRLYLVTGEDISDGQAVVMAAVAGGVTMVQVRAKHGTTAERAGAAQRLSWALAPLGVPLLINDDVVAARLAGADGLHLGPDDMHPAMAREIIGPSVVLGWSLHSFDQLADSDALDACDYLAASPVWATPTKTDTTPPLGLEGVRALRAAMPAQLPLVAIGGITAATAGDVIRAGADGVAVVSAIWSAPDPEGAAGRLRAIVDAALNERSQAR